MSVTYEDVAQGLVTCFQAGEDSKWSAGDLLLQLGPKAPIKQLAGSCGRSASYLHLLRQVAKKFPYGTRAHDMSWSIHALCARAEEHLYWLDQAIEFAYSTRELRAAMVEAGVVKPAKKPEPMFFQEWITITTCPHCGESL